MALAFLAGLVTLLNPCVLPVLPVVIASSVSRSRAGPIALAAGLIAGFTVFGMLVLTVGFSIGLDQSTLRLLAAGILIVAGAILTAPSAQAAFAGVTAPVAAVGGRWLEHVSGDAWHGQFGIGVLLGIVWTPCVGPTIGVAIAAASRGENLIAAFATFLVFGIGVAVSLVLVAWASRRLLLGGGSKFRSIARWGKQALGVTLIVVGAMILTGLDKALETAVLEAMPDWLIRFTTRF